MEQLGFPQGGPKRKKASPCEGTKYKHYLSYVLNLLIGLNNYEGFDYHGTLHVYG